MALVVLAANLPSMGGAEIGASLSNYASEVPMGQSIVEVGCWLGAGTAHLALGARGNPVHVYDRFVANKREVAKASAFGVELIDGEDTLPRVKRSLEPFGANITWHKGGIQNAKWSGDPIGLYVDDASKSPRMWFHASSTFLPHVPVGGIVVLMDYRYYEKGGLQWASQVRYMRNRPRQYEMIADRLAGTTAAVFRRC